MFKQRFVLRNAVKRVMKAMGGYDRSGSIQLSLPKEKGEDGDEQVHLCHPQDLRCLRWKIMDQLDQQTAGVILVSNGVIDRRKVNGAIADPGLDSESLRKILFERGEVHLLDLTNGNDVNVGHGWVDVSVHPVRNSAPFRQDISRPDGT
jgi:hypothetical protein